MTLAVMDRAAGPWFYLGTFPGALPQAGIRETVGPEIACDNGKIGTHKAAIAHENITRQVWVANGT